MHHEPGDVRRVRRRVAAALRSAAGAVAVRRGRPRRGALPPAPAREPEARGRAGAVREAAAGRARESAHRELPVLLLEELLHVVVERLGEARPPLREHGLRRGGARGDAGVEGGDEGDEEAMDDMDAGMDASDDLDDAADDEMDAADAAGRDRMSPAGRDRYNRRDVYEGTKKGEDKKGSKDKAYVADKDQDEDEDGHRTGEKAFTTKKGMKKKTGPGKAYESLDLDVIDDEELTEAVLQRVVERLLKRQ